MNTPALSNNHILSASLSFLTALVLSTHSQTANTASNEPGFSPYVDKAGNISLPADFRITMAHLGSWFAPEGDGRGFHDVYTEATSVLYYRKHGKFPDGATIVKEVRAEKSGDYTTGKNISFATGEIKQWFVMIKDTKGRFPGNLNWGDGWGWALIKTDHTNKNVSTNYQADCINCHMPAKENDWIYVNEYPTLTTRNR
ncbi:cytochrome P460 family protein [Nitrosomonas sp. Nm166]|uniref:cytochrome P460 family protein n=1 Tax=Nitrosomonas sp. Nm166 TaxID=1881054 RepID=UPI0008E6685F|nr:cytochrome P460 family protein [Nitrosomonas sp. Nm166]SFD84300.1 Cytochrome P460 [Nitrosomonas sp. Nm166]